MCYIFNQTCLSLFWIKTTSDQFTCWHISSVCLLWVHKGSVAICNMFILEACNVYVLLLDYWLLRGLIHANVTCSKSPLNFLIILLAPDHSYTGVGLQAVWLESPYFYRGRLSWKFFAVSTVSQCQVAWSSDCIPWLTDGLTDERRCEDILVALLKKQGLWPEPVAYNCLLNWLFLTGKRWCLLPFWVS